MRDILANPPVKWTLERKRKYFDDAKAVVEEIRDANAALAGRFDRLYSHWSKLNLGTARAPQAVRRPRSVASALDQTKIDLRRKALDELVKVIKKALQEANSTPSR